jgi:hypothetical protein
MILSLTKTPKVKVNPLTAEQRAIRKARTSNTFAIRELMKKHG